MAQKDADPASTATSQGQTIFGDSVVRVRAANLGVAVVRDLVKAIVTGSGRSRRRSSPQRAPSASSLP